MAACLDPYHTNQEFGDVTPLVVNAFIDAGEKIATVSLTRAQPLNETDAYSVVEGAQVEIALSSGQKFQLPEKRPGHYAFENIGIDFNADYILHISTTTGEKYTSDPVRIKRTPPIDSVTWGESPPGDALDIMVSAHDLTGDARYFIWSFEETWEYHARYFSFLKWVNGTPAMRTPDEYVYTCFRNFQSSNILLATNDQLDKPVISEQVLTRIPSRNERTQFRYSVIVTQRVLTQAEFQFQTNLRNTTENLGGLFDPMPSQVTSNIHSNADKNIPVLGYFAGGEIVRKRVYIQFNDLPESLRVSNAPMVCPQVATTCSLFAPPKTADGSETTLCEYFYDLQPSSVGIVSEIRNPRTNIVEAYTYAPIECTDCRQQGGTTTRPVFWPAQWQ
jgi:Domain of unknown function (DUF4249)